MDLDSICLQNLLNVQKKPVKMIDVTITVFHGIREKLTVRFRHYNFALSFKWNVETVLHAKW